MKKFLGTFILFVVIFIPLLLVFKNWFSGNLLVSGDWVYYWNRAILDINNLPAWDGRHMGMGASNLSTLWLESYFLATIKTALFLGWNWYEKIFWFWPYLLFGFLSAWSLYFYFFKSKVFALLAGFLYIANTYALLLVGGGQTGIALSYSLAPFGFIAFEELLQKITLRSAVIFSLVFSLIFLLDIRIGYILLFLLTLRFVFELPGLTGEKVKKYFLLFTLSGILIIGLHAFWLLPTLLTHGKAIRQFGDIYTSSKSIQFFSFAKFEDALGLLHPNWPENIFGFTHFMRWEFLLLPILAFGSLFFIDIKQKKEKLAILFFSLIGLLGVFLAKGANDPFGNTYIWLFDHVPGFIMFRDPTKWYMIIAISYSVLIPFTIFKTSNWLSQKEKFSTFNFKFSIKPKIFNFQIMFFLLFVGCLVFLVRPAVVGQLGGTFQQHTFPKEYTTLDTFLNNQSSFGRILWVPQPQKFGAHISENHPSVDAYNFFNVASISGVLDALHENKTENELREASIGYVVVPYDSQGEFFLTDRKYDQKVYLDTVREVRRLSYLTELNGFGKIHVFALSQVKNHFWLTGQGKSFFMQNATTQYAVNVQNVTKGEMLIFSDMYDPFWQAQVGGKSIDSTLFDKRFNSFILPKDGNYDITIVYKPQQWVEQGVQISIATLIVAGLLVLFGYAGLFMGKNGKIQG
ncbi:MAG TPA: hypothetical protein VEW42_00300 [Candidatus Eisenbacteria bacterium]|nr:hypothetical protein [Candidatus Eisenbacteria bacterium]